MDSELSCSLLIPLLQTEFGSLWQCRTRGQSLEIVTPYSTANGHFASVFVTRRGDDIVVTDGGWISSTTYHEDGEEASDQTVSGIIEYFASQFSVAAHKAPDAREYYFKKAKKDEQIPAFVHDLANFICGVVNGVAYDHASRTETQSREQFRTKANTFILDRIGADKVGLNEPLDDIKGATFQAIVRGTGGTVSLITYSTGHDFVYYTNSLRTAYCNFALAEHSKYNRSNLIRQRVALLDDEASGYVPDRLEPFIQLIKEKTQRPPIPWANRDELVSAISS